MFNTIIRDALPRGSSATCLFFPRNLWSIIEQTHGNMESLSQTDHGKVLVDL